MGIERRFNKDGQEQIIQSLDTIVKIGDKFLQVRLIETRKWHKDEFTAPMPRAKFIDYQPEFCYLIKADDLKRLLKKANKK